MDSNVRILPIGGLGEIGKNMTVVEYNDEIIIIDCGIMFPENDMLGIDYIIPDYSYVVERKENVVGVLFTHGHEDHIGAVNHLMKEIDAPIFATPLTAGMIKNKLREGQNLQKSEINIIQAGDKFDLGTYFTIEPFHMSHSIPDCVGFGITTPVGLIVHTGDYKFDHTPVDGWPPDFAKLSEFSQRGVLCLLADSTNAERKGWTPSEIMINDAFDEVFENAPGRIIVATFASLISRIQLVANAAYKHGRKFAVVGRSMRDNVKLAQEMGYLDLPDGLLIDIDTANALPAHKVAIMATGSQGEPTSVIGRLAFGRGRHLSMQEDDTIVISAHAIPGNEETVYRIINRLFQLGANVVYDDIANVHVSGHASREEMKLLINLVKPRYLIPVHGEIRHLRQHGLLAAELGIPDEHIAVIENGYPVEISRRKIEIGERLPGGYVYIDGSGSGDVTRRVLRDRERLAEAGFFSVAVRAKGNKLVEPPEYLTRGFLNLDDDVLKAVTDVVSKTIKTHGSKFDGNKLGKLIEEAVIRHLHSETGKRPWVFAVMK